MSRAPVIGLALGSGGARGWAHIGVIEGLLALGIRPAVVTGTSIGALVGAMFAAGVWERFVAEAKALNWVRLVKFFAEFHWPRHGLLSGQPICAWLAQEELLGQRRAEDLAVTFAAVATDLDAEQAVVLHTGRLTELVRASISIPGVFDPVLREGRVLVDGGLTEPVPVQAARDLGATCVIGVDINAFGGKPPRTARKKPSLMGTLMQTLRIVENEVCRLTLSQRPADVLIGPPTGFIQTLDFAGGRAGVELGYQAVMDARETLLGALEKGREDHVLQA